MVAGMVILWVIFLVLASLFLRKLWKSNEEEKKRLYANEPQIEEKEQPMMENEKKGARDLLLETLTKIGCQYKVGEEEDDNRIYFAYQGEHFFVNASNDAWYIQIFDTNWGHVELYDIDEFARLKKAINESNLANAVMTVYTIDETGSNVYVHCKSTILFVPQIPHIEAYLKTELDAFFHAHHSVGNEMARLRENEKI